MCLALVSCNPDNTENKGEKPKADEGTYSLIEVSEASFPLDSMMGFETGVFQNVAPTQQCF